MGTDGVIDKRTGHAFDEAQTPVVALMRTVKIRIARHHFGYTILLR